MRKVALRPRARSQSPSPATGGRNDSPSPSPSPSTGRRRSAWPATGGPSPARRRSKRASPATRTRDHCPSPSPARKRGKIASPAFGGRSHSRSPSPAGGQGTPAIGGKPVQLLKRYPLGGLPANCPDYKSELVLSKADGLNDASSRNLHKQKSVLEDADRFYALLQEMPPPAKGRPLAAWKQP